MRKFFLIGIIATILIAVPLTVYILTTQKTTTQSGAAPSTLLAFTVPSEPASVGTPIAIPITVDPSGGGSTPNQVSFIKVVVQYDGSKLQAASNYFVADQKLSTLEGPTNSCDNNSHTCTIAATLSTGADPNNTISSQATIATLNFTPLTPTDANIPTKLTFASGSQALSIASSDKPAENVLAISRLQPGALTIVAGDVTPTPPSDTTGNTTNTTTGGSTTTGTAGSSGTSAASAAPISCTSFTADNTSADTAPLTVLLTAVGGSTAGNVTKVSFNYGDGTVQDVTTGGGIGTNSVSIQSSHIYKTTGTFTATAVLTDDAGNTTTPSDCSQTITIGSQGASTSDTPTPTQVTQATTAPTIPATGPGNVILGVGAVGVVITAVGLLFAIGI